MSHLSFLENLIIPEGCKKIAEIGVLKGDLSVHLLKRCSRITDYYMIDPWAEYPVEQRTEDYWHQDFWDDVYLHVLKRMEPFKKKAHIIRAVSERAKEIIKDRSLDLVFIDAFDTYVDVTLYIRDWLPKVKPEGFIAGHDWDKPEVRSAVTDCFGMKNVHIAEGNCWYVLKSDWLSTQPPDEALTVTITSCGRFDLLKRTIDSLRETVGGPTRIFICDDGDDEKQHELIRKEFGESCNVRIPPKSHGLAWSLDYLYSLVETTFFLHCEDDWEFVKPGYIDRSLDVLTENPDVAVVGIVKDKMFEQLGAVGARHETKNGTAFHDHPVWRIDENHIPWNGWISSPNLKRKADYIKMGKFQQVETESLFDRQVWAKSGKKSVWLEDLYAKHIGAGRPTRDPRDPTRLWTVPRKKPSVCFTCAKREFKHEWACQIWEKLFGGSRVIGNGYTKEYFEKINREETEQAYRLAEILMKEYEISSVIDVGCATGLYLKPFLEKDAIIRGIDKSADAWDMAVVPKNQILLWDVTDPIMSIGNWWSIAICLELLEHIDEERSDAVFDNLCRLSDTIVFSAAHPGQGGVGHVNCRKKEYWAKKFEKRGYVLDKIKTKTVIREMKKGYHMGWLAMNLMIFRKEKEDGR